MGRPCSAQRALTLDLDPPNDEQKRALSHLIARRIEGVPLSHLTERQQFMGLEMMASPDALAPRLETEILARVAIDLAASMNHVGEPTRVIDVCTGSGNVALAIAHYVPSAQLHGADLSESAIELAKRNAAHLQLEHRVEWRCGDLLTPFDTPELAGRVDMITCNPPYISSAKVNQMPQEISQHEPRLAFDGGPFGVSILLRLLEQAPRLLRPGGWLAFEVGAGQGPAMLKRLQSGSAFADARSHADAAGTVRALAARRAAQEL
jgi:release factor glutamine methyltransferase